MEPSVNEYLACEVRVVIRFLAGIGRTQVEIHKQVKRV